jgi:hypothetical protein
MKILKPERAVKDNSLSKRRRIIASVGTAFLIMAGFLGLSISSASAATSASPSASASVQILYPINVPVACEQKGHLGALAWNTTPYGWFCINASTSPPFWDIAGGVDMQGYCNRDYPGSTAIIYRNNLYGWRCSEWVTF